MIRTFHIYISNTRTTILPHPTTTQEQLSYPTPPPHSTNPLHHNTPPHHPTPPQYSTPPPHRPIVYIRCMHMLPRVSIMPVYTNITSNVTNHLDEQQILYPLQHRFRRERSCKRQLIEFVEDVTINMEDGHQTDVLVMDLPKALIRYVTYCSYTQPITMTLQEKLTSR